MGHLYRATGIPTSKKPSKNQNLQSDNLTVTVADVKSTVTVIKGIFGGVVVEMIQYSSSLVLLVQCNVLQHA